jgi:outer membrane protein assembly factor BamA
MTFRDEGKIREPGRQACPAYNVVKPEADMNRFGVLTVLFLLGSTSFCQTADQSGSTLYSPAGDLSQYLLEAVIFEGGRSFPPERLKDTFNVPIGSKFNHIAVGKGLDRLTQLYNDNGYINFTAVPALQLNKDRGTIILTISIDEGDQFTFGRLFLAGQETRAGEADALRNGWAALSGKRYDSSLLSKWLMKNATFLPNDGQPLRHVEEHVDSSTHQVDFALTSP